MSGRVRHRSRAVTGTLLSQDLDLHGVALSGQLLRAPSPSGLFFATLRETTTLVEPCARKSSPPRFDERHQAAGRGPFPRGVEGSP